MFILTIWQWSARQLFGSSADVITLATTYVYGSAVSAIVAIAQTAGMFSTFGVETWGRATGLTGHPNDAGGSLAVAIVLAVAMLREHSTRRLQATTAVLAVGLILSASVSGMGAALIGVLYLVARGRRRIRFVVTTAAVLTLFYVIGTTLQTRIAEDGVGELAPWARLAQTTGAGDANTVRSRLDTVRVGLSGIVDSPLAGHGLDAESGVVHDGLGIHNAPVLAWYQGGVIFFAGMSIAVVFSLGTGLGRRDSFLAPAAVTAVVFAQSAPVLYHRYFWFPLVLLVTARTVRRASRSDRPSVPIPT